MASQCLSTKAHKDLFDFFNLEENDKMHWIHTFSWVMVQPMHCGIILKAINFVVGITQYLSLNCDEVNIIDN
jgi:hypothetical protein